MSFEGGHFHVRTAYFNLKGWCCAGILRNKDKGYQTHKKTLLFAEKKNQSKK